MIETIKKSLLAGVGAVVVTKDKIEEALADFVKDGKVTADDARKMAEKVAAQGRQEFYKACAELTSAARQVTGETGDKSKEAITALEKRLKALEKKLAEAAQPKQRAAAARPRSSAKSASSK